MLSENSSVSQSEIKIGRLRHVLYILWERSAGKCDLLSCLREESYMGSEIGRVRTASNQVLILRKQQRYKKIGTGEYRCEHCGTKLFTEGQKSGEEEEARDADVAVLVSEAQAYADKKDYRNELLTLAKAMKLDPENNTVLLRLGRAYWRLGLPEKAIEYYRIAEELYPDDPIVYTNIGAAYIRLGHYAEAKVQYEKGMSIIESNPMSACADDIAITYGNYALCLGKLGDKDGAKEYLTLAKEKGYSKDSINSVCKQLHLNRFTI